jgi:hypothetical protein
MTQLLIIMAAATALPAIGRLVAALVTFIVKLVAMIFVLGLTGLVLFLVMAFATHGHALYRDEELMMAIPVEL